MVTDRIELPLFGVTAVGGPNAWRTSAHGLCIVVSHSHTWTVRVMGAVVHVVGRARSLEDAEKEAARQICRVLPQTYADIDAITKIMRDRRR